MNKPDQPRHELSWKEQRAGFDRFKSIIQVLDQATPEFAESAKAAKIVLTSLHKKWMKVTTIVKRLHFEPSAKYDHPVSS